MADLNQAQIIGRLGRDPETKTFSNGGSLCNMTVATSKKWKDRNTGEAREATEWHNVTVTGEHSIRFAEQYLAKGDQVFIQGELRTRKWQDQSGQDRYTTEVVVSPFGGVLSKLSAGNSAGDRPANIRQQSEGAAQHPPARDIDDEIPF